MARRLLLQQIAGLVAATCMPAWARHGATQRIDDRVAGWRLESLALTNDRRQAVTEQLLQGHWNFVLFGSASRCAEQCVEALNALVGMHKRIAPSDKIKTTQLLFVALDAAADTPQRLRAYLAGYDAPIIGYTGTPQMLQRLRDELEIAPDSRSSLWLIGPDLVVRGEFLPPFDAKLLAAVYLRTRLRG